MTEEAKRRGRPPKSHLHEDHHFRTSDDAEAAGAPPASADSDQADAIEVAPAAQFASAALIHEAVVENPIPSMDSTSMSLEIPLKKLESEEQGNAVKNSLKESPVEEKIHELMDAASLNGWESIDTKIVIKMPPRNGMPIRLSENPDEHGVLAMWKKTRKFANTTHRWMESGKWVDFQSGMDISFIPKYWKERF